MGILLLIVPLLVYYLIIVPILKIKVINEIQSKKLKTLAFILLLLFPIGDHLIGYVVYKTLCYTKGGVYIYKTVTNEQEQRDYWFYEGLNVFNNSYDDKEFKYLADNKLVKRGICTNLLKDGNVGERVCAKGGFKEVYLNYCNPKYNTLPKDHKNYKYSCINADEIIKKYSLKNVIKVPKSLYSFYSSTFDKSYNYNVIPFLQITLAIDMIKNYKTDEILAISREYAFGGGWFIKLVSPYPFGIGCSKKDLYDYHTKVIPNPYINNKGK